jgi:hypothetical protein
MRSYQVLAAVVLAVAFAAPAKAQSAVTFGGNRNQNITYYIINPSAQANVPNAPIAQPMSSVFSGSKLAGFFHWPSTRSSTPVIGSSRFPSRSQLPNGDYLSGFGYQRGHQ